MSGAPRDLPTAVCLMGPTGVGKTALAVRLVERLALDIVSVDSAMVYRGLDIGTAKPDAATLARAPHRLIDLIEPAEAYSAGRFRADALAAMASIRAAGRVPLLVGGTGLYFRALTEGLAPLPPRDAAVRERIEARRAEQGTAALHRWLGEVDPEAAGRIGPNDLQRLQRALEVFLLTGRPLSRWLREAPPEPPAWRFLKLVLLPADRGLLRERLARRFLDMLERGFIDEVAALRAAGRLEAGMPGLKLVGYGEVWRHLTGELDRPGMTGAAIAATCRLAKRQMTWLRAERAVHGLRAESADVTESALQCINDARILSGA